MIRRVWVLVLLAACNGSPLSSRPAAKDGSADGPAGPDGSTAIVDGLSDGAPRDHTDANTATLPDGRCIDGAFPHDAVCACEPTVPTVCGDHCVDTLLDDDNCGGCGNACSLGATCNGGRCGPDPTLVQPAPARDCTSLHIAVDGATLYWTNEGTGEVLRSPTTGGAPTPIATGEDRPTWISVRGDRVFWTAGGPDPSSVENPISILGRSLRTTATTGGAVTTLATPADGIYGYTVSPDGETVYLSLSDAIAAVKVSGGAPVPIAMPLEGAPPRALAAEGTKLAFLTVLTGRVWILDLVEGAVATCGTRDPVTGRTVGACTRLETDNGSLLPDAVLIKNNLLLWANADTIRSHDLSTSMDDTPAVVSLGGFVNALCASDDTLFLVGDDRRFDDPDTLAHPTRNGVIERSSLAPGSTAVALARGQHRPSSIATDGRRVYWSTTDCTILSTTP